jgi:ribonuclease HI
MNGKGSKPRPIKNINKYISNWEQINWSKNEEKKPPKNMDAVCKSNRAFEKHECGY